MAAERQRECADDHEEQLQHASIVAGIGAKINGTSFGEPQGMRATARRVESSIHACGKYSNAPSNHARVPVQSAAVVATWQLAILPSAPHSPLARSPMDFGQLAITQGVRYHEG